MCHLVGINYGNKSFIGNFGDTVQINITTTIYSRKEKPENLLEKTKTYRRYGIALIGMNELKFKMNTKVW